MAVIRGVRYARFSSDNQREESIDAQLRAIDKDFEEAGIICVGTYIDIAKSATTDRRPEFQKMIADSAKGLFDVVGVHKINRWARNRYDAAFYKRKLKMNGVKIRYAVEKIDDSPEMIMLEAMLEGYAEFFSKDLAREVRKGMYENALKCQHTGGRPAYGFRVDPETKKYLIDEKRAPAVYHYFEGVLLSKSNEQIAAELNEMGYRTQTGRKFTKNSFDGWATNEKYDGVYTWDLSAEKREDGSRNSHSKKPVEQQLRIPGGMPRIIPHEMFVQVGEIMKVRKREPGRMKAKIVYLLTGKIVCGKCGSQYSGNSYRNKKSSEETLLTYYKCSGKCGNTSVRKDDIEAVAIDHLVKTVLTNEGIEEVVDRVQKLYAKEKEEGLKALAPLKKELADLERKIENWIDMLGEGIKSIAPRIKEAEKQKDIIEAELRRIEILHEANTFISEDAIRRLLESKKHSLFSADEDEKKQVLQEFVERIVIQPSNKISEFDTEITYRVFSGGGEGNRTPVRRPRYMSFYECSRLFWSFASGTRSDTLPLG